MIHTRSPVPFAFQTKPGARPVHPPRRKADYSKAMPLDTHPLATEPGAPVRFTFHAKFYATLKAAYLLSNDKDAKPLVTARGIR